MRLQIQLAEVESHFDNFQVIAPAISAVPIAWQLHHILAVINQVAYALEQSNPKEYSYSFRFSRSFIMLRGSIPRGLGKAPERVNKKGEIDKAELIAGHENALKALQMIKELPPHSFFKHPYFGNMKVKHAKRFLQIHTEHHLKIVRDILKA